MSEFEIIASQTPGIIEFSNYEEIRNGLTAYVDSRFSNIDYSVEGREMAERDSKELKSHKDAITKVKKELNAAYSAPYVEVEKKLNELIAILDEPLKKAKNFVDDFEKEEKEIEIYDYARRAVASLGDAGGKIIESNAFFNSKWLNKTTRMKSIHEDIDRIVENAKRDIDIIQRTGGEQTPVLVARYYETLSMEGMDTFISNMSSNDDIDVSGYEDEKNVVGYKILRITATEDQMAFIISQLNLMRVEYDEIEDGMPQPMEELTEPGFNSFVAFDIETTGTNGAANGDEDARITEIGAVRVVDGKITERFDQLANPGRKIVPRIARLTHITDEMVADKPPVDEVIRMFNEFVGDSILVGHNIKSSDLRYISKAADKAGVHIKGPFFDTYIYAKKFKTQKHWEKVNLPYLAEQYGFVHTEAHRAWSDAEVNAKVYFELQRI